MKKPSNSNRIIDKNIREPCETSELLGYLGYFELTRGYIQGCTWV